MRSLITPNLRRLRFGFIRDDMMVLYLGGGRGGRPQKGILLCENARVCGLPPLPPFFPRNPLSCRSASEASLYMMQKLRENVVISNESRFVNKAGKMRNLLLFLFMTFSINMICTPEQALDFISLSVT
jgi:hypothetical protein